jgi:lysophospholipase L1-like esterase
MSQSARVDTGTALALLLSAGSLLVVTCAGGQQTSQTPNLDSATLSAPSSQPHSSTAAPSASALPQALPLEPTPTSTSAAPDPLTTFWTQLRQLTEHQRSDHVRVLWLGDSHTAADFWVHPVRKALGEIAGRGGPGYLQIGLGVYRHGAATVESTGKWAMVPRAPSYFVGPQGDATFGLAGVRTVPKTGASEATVRVAKGALRGRVLWKIIYRLPDAGSRFSVRLDPGETHEVRSGMGTPLDSGLFSLALESEATATLRVGHAQGEPQLFGVIAEGSEPGLVIDTLGINGARVATTLTWDQAHFVAQVKQRNPALVVLAYGTNEIGDALAPWRYAAQYDALLARLRDAVPNVACLILGPPERALADWSGDPREIEIEQVQRQVANQHGCAFFSTIDAMGGPGSLQRWAFASPPLAQKDRVHLTPHGYETLGDALARSLLASRPSLPAAAAKGGARR